MSSIVGVGLVGGLTPREAASARRVPLSSSSYSFSFCQVATWSPLFSTATSTRLMSAPADAYSTTDVAFHKLRSARVPWLVLPPQALEQQRRRGQQEGRDLDGEHGCVVTDNHFMGLLDVDSGTIVPVPVPHDAEEELLNWRWIGSSQGWLVLGDPKTNLLCLFNPIDSLLCEDSTKPSYNCVIRIPLPDTYPRVLPTRVFLTSPPSSSSHSQGAKCQVFVVYESYIAFCSLNADSNSSPPWKLLTTLKHGAGPYEDVFLDGRWLVTLSPSEEGVWVEHWYMDCKGGSRIETCSLGKVPVKSRLVLSHGESMPHLQRKIYLLRWSPPGQPLECMDEGDEHDEVLVMRYVASDVSEDGTPVDKRDFSQKMLDKLRHKTVAFEVYRNDAIIRGFVDWERVESLGNRTLFLGNNQSLAIPVAAGGGSPIKSNCIYFTDDYEGDGEDPPGGHDCGVFDMADQTIRSLDRYNFAKLHPRPMWLLPSSQP